LVMEVVEQLKVDASAVLLLNPRTQTLDFAANRGFRTEALKFTSLKVGTGLAGQAAQERKIVHVANLAKLKNNPSFVKSIAKEKFVSYFGVPLIAKGQVLGVLEIFRRSAFDPDPNWLTFLETLAGQAAISIDNARLLEMTQVSLKETNALYQIIQDLVATVDPEQLMRNVVDLLHKNFEYDHVQIFIADPETGDFVVRAGSGKIGKQLVRQGYRLAAGEGIVGLTAETGAPFFTNDVNQVISFVRNPLLPKTKSELAVPIKTATQFLGLIDIQQVPPAFLKERDVQLVSAVADQLAVALQKARLYADLQNSLRQEKATRSQLIQSEKLAVAGRLLASVSHELNNPLQAIQNTLFLLQNEGKLSKQGQQDLKTVLSETERMATLIERLRTTYQPARAEDFKPVQINSIIEDVQTLIATHLRHAKISFEFHSIPELPAIPGLENQLKQVMLNMFMNAVDAMVDGGRLIVSTDRLLESKEILITVTDTGAGIDESVLPYIFEAFTTNKEKGTGLGLAISYEIVLKHHGRIQAKNNPQGGATFSIWLPVDNGDAQ
jgi:signal transduction histidine kinase